MNVQLITDLLTMGILMGQLNPNKDPKYLIAQFANAIIEADKTGKIDISSLVGEYGT